MSEAAHFKRVLNERQVVALAFGAMIGWSWVLVAGFWVANAGSLGTLLAFLIGGLAITLVGIIYSELASAMPKVATLATLTPTRMPAVSVSVAAAAATVATPRRVQQVAASALAQARVVMQPVALAVTPDRLRQL